MTMMAKHSWARSTSAAAAARRMAGPLWQAAALPHWACEDRTDRSRPTRTRTRTRSPSEDNTT